MPTEDKVVRIEKTEAIRATLAKWPCATCEAGVHFIGPHYDLDTRCEKCRLTMGERIQLGTLMAAGPSMVDRMDAFFKEHRMPEVCDWCHGTGKRTRRDDPGDWSGELCSRCEGSGKV